MNITLSTVLVANMVGINAYTIFSGDGESRSNRLMVDREGVYLRYLETDTGLFFATHVKRADNGKLALCMEHVKPAPIKEMYTKREKITDLGMKHIALSEPNMGSFEEDYYVKQMTLNYYQGDANYIKGNLSKGEKYRAKAYEIAEKAEKVRDGIETSPYFANNTISLATANNEFQLDGDYYVSDWFNVTHTGDLQRYSVELNNAPNNTQVLNQGGNVVSELSDSDTKFKLRVHKDNIDRVYDNIDISLVGTFNELEPTRYYPDDDKYQIVLLMDEYPIQIRSGGSVKNTLDPKGGIKVIKVSEDGTRLQGAFFELRKNGTLITNGTTNTAGEVTFSDLELGNYEVIEKTAPTGHFLNSTPSDVTVRAGRQTDVTVDNEVIKGRISVTKRDAEINNLFIEGAEFEIYDALGNVVDKITTDTNGYAETRLLNFGTYTMKEVKAPEGYRLDNTTVHTVNITEHNKTYAHDIDNQIYKGKVHIVKIDSQNEETPVQGAGFDIIAEDVKGVAKDTIVDHVITDENGFAITNDLRYGTYRIREVDTPPGFWKPNKDCTMDIKEDGKTYVRFIKNDPVEAKIRVVKTDGKTKEILSGVKFKIRDKVTDKDIVFKEYVGGKVVDKIEFTTDEYGEFVTPQVLRTGEYQLIETEGLEGYVVLDPIDFTIDENTAMEDIEAVGKVVTMNTENERITGNMKLSKIDMYTKKPLSDVEFLIEGVEGFMKDKTFKMTTNEDGIVQLDDLEYGKYKVTEVKTNEEYVLNEEPTFFDIANNGETIELTFENKPKEGYIEINKIDSDSKKPLKDVEFTIYNESDEEIEKLVTDKDGKVKSDKLRYGKYKLVETKVLENYIDNNLEIEFEILNDGEIIKKEVENESMKGDLEFTKVDASTGKVLPGAKIKLTGLDKHNEYIEMEFVSSLEGNKFRLPTGEYKIKEISAPEGYSKTFKTETFEIVQDEVMKIGLKNKKKPIGSGGSLNKPSTGDMTYMFAITSIASIVGLVVLNRDKFKKKD